MRLPLHRHYGHNNPIAENSDWQERHIPVAHNSLLRNLLVLAISVRVWGQEPTELERLKAQNELLAEQVKQLQYQLQLQSLTASPSELKQLQDQNAILAERLKLATTSKSLADANTPANATLQRLTEENSLLEQQLKIANNTKAIADASVPKFTGGLDGTTTISGDASAESVQLAYQALANAATQMAGDIANCGPNDRIMVFNATEIAAFDTLHAFRLQSALLSDLMTNTLNMDSRTLEPPDANLSAAPLGLMLAGPIIQSFIDFTKLFRVNREITSKDLTPDDKAFLAILASKIRAKPGGGCHIYHPEMVPAKLFEPVTLPASGLPQDLDQLTVLRDYLATLSSPPNTLGDWLRRVFDLTAVLRIRFISRTDEKMKVDQEIEKLAPEVKKWRDQVDSIPTLEASVAGLRDKQKKLETKLKELLAAHPVDVAAVRKTRKDIEDTKEALEAKNKDLVAAQAAKADKEKQAAADRLRLRQRYSAQLGELLKALNAAIEAGNSYRSDLFKGDAAGSNFLSRLSRTARLESELKNCCSYSSILHVSVQKLSAATLKKTNVWGTQHTFSGGAIATYLQFGVWDGSNAVSGELIREGTFTGYTGQHKPGPETPMPPVAGTKL